jgi:DNA-binding MarR family transcriptional regulator
MQQQRRRTAEQLFAGFGRDEAAQLEQSLDTVLDRLRGLTTVDVDGSAAT